MLKMKKPLKNLQIKYMNKIHLLSLGALLLSCTAKVENNSICHSHAISRYQKEIENTTKEIEDNKKTSEKALRNLDQLQDKLHKQQIAFIKKKVMIFVSKTKKLQKDEKVYKEFLAQNLDDLFLDERKVLINVIEASDKYREYAHNVLEDILRIITVLNEKK